MIAFSTLLVTHLQNQEGKDGMQGIYPWSDPNTALEWAVLVGEP